MEKGEDIWTPGLQVWDENEKREQGLFSHLGRCDPGMIPSVQKVQTHLLGAPLRRVYFLYIEPMKVSICGEGGIRPRIAAFLFALRTQ